MLEFVVTCIHSFDFQDGFTLVPMLEDLQIILTRQLKCLSDLIKGKEEEEMMRTQTTSIQVTV